MTYKEKRINYIKNLEDKMRSSIMRKDLFENTPNVEMQPLNGNQMYAKLEGYNFFGSAKDRAAAYVINKLLDNGVINLNTEIIESSSGNMGVALAGVCGAMGIKVTIVIDQSINKMNEYLIRAMGANVIKATKPDENNSFLKERLSIVKEYIKNHENVYWFNQYENELIPIAYKETVGKEIIREIPDIDMVFVAISSGGTICGIADAMKEYNPQIEVVAVDVKGSKIFEPNTSVKKHFTGIGSSIQTVNMKKAKFDDYIVIDEERARNTLQLLLAQEKMFLGGSSGCVYAGAQKYLVDKHITGKKVVCVFHDMGGRYFESIYQKI